MNKSKKEASNANSMKKALNLSAAVAALGMSLGVNAENIYAAAIGIDGFSLPAVQLKFENTQLKFDSLQYKGQIFLDSSQLKIESLQQKCDSIQQKCDTTGFSFDLSNYKEDPALFNLKFPELYIFPDNISPDKPFSIQIPLNEDGNPFDFNFLTFGIDSFSSDVTNGVLSITDVQRTAVPEPSTLLTLGSGIAGLIVIRRLKKGRVI